MTGPAVAATDTASKVIKDLYGGLDRISRCLVGGVRNADAEQAGSEKIAAQLRETDSRRDKDLPGPPQALLAQIDPTGTRKIYSKYVGRERDGCRWQRDNDEGVA
jgi:hypothetical protein